MDAYSKVKQAELLEIRKLALVLPGKMREVNDDAIFKLIGSKVRYDALAGMIISGWLTCFNDPSNENSWKELQGLMEALDKHLKESAGSESS